MATDSLQPASPRGNFFAASLYLGASLFLMLCAVHEHGRWRSPPIALATPALLPALAPVPMHEPAPKKNLVSIRKESPAAIYHRLGAYVARRFRISAPVATDIVEKAYAVGHRLKLDPLLILAVISIESGFNPLAESIHGAKGLMQVMPRWHADKLDAVGGEEKVFELEPNILVGARILKEYLLPTGDLGDALQRYLGASDEEQALEYSERVARERDLFAEIARRVPQIRTAL